ncbi:hypothetical protein HPP92_025215 [Vanilla planifolia]|uniref:SANT domain-containing protein n=1 Tax=Vanilla planifolia TaxID=51239 RepID=A0A835PI13_VANPL|nr:hypothetical protein HPP92_025215 [Vanilla planifolia]
MDGTNIGSEQNCVAKLLSVDSPSSSSDGTNDLYQDSVVGPRVGEQYQVHIPPLTRATEFFPVLLDSSKMSVIDASHGIGLAIPVWWVQRAGDGISSKNMHEEYPNKFASSIAAELDKLQNGSSVQTVFKLNTLNVCASQYSDLNGSLNESSLCKVESPCSLYQTNHVSNSVNSKIRENCQKDVCSSSPTKNVGYFFALPGSPNSSWTEEEMQSFILALHIFGKNFIQVKKFMENKRMEDIISLYYGKFFRSDAYHRWSECRKSISKRSIFGQRIFTGWRQHELLSRVLTVASKDLRDSLLEAANTFNAGRTTLEEFVFKLKAAVGLQGLVEAIGIGKGKQDLTGVALDHFRTNQNVNHHPGVPVGRAFSSLTTGSIIKFLTGDFRLSKARSNDLFWEAVWPRLLACGWHSEQPKSYSFSSKNNLVFLVPGVKKFSRKKLVKGNHYFDSVSDVLSKVASDTRLLELDFEGSKDRSSIKEDNVLRTDERLDQNGSSNCNRHSYLRPKFPNCNLKLMKFTVVDTSLIHIGGNLKVREVRSLPSEATSIYGTCDDLEGSGSESSSEDDESNDSSDEDSIPVSIGELKTEDYGATLPEVAITTVSFPNTITIKGPSPDAKELVELKSNNVVQGNCQHIPRARSIQIDSSAPLLKQRKLNACSRGTVINNSMASKFLQQEKQQKHSKPSSLKAVDTVLVEASSLQEKTNFPHPKSIPEDSINGEMNPPEDKIPSQTLFDLNNLPPDVDMEVSSNIKTKSNEPLQSSQTHQIGNQLSEESSSMAVDEQPSLGNRRHGTRNRPPTARALEALACGFLGTKRSLKSSVSLTRPARRARKSLDESALDRPLSIGSGFITLCDAETPGKDHNEPARKGTHDLLGVP